jgi:hypothetical protein
VVASPMFEFGFEPEMPLPSLSYDRAHCPA